MFQRKSQALSETGEGTRGTWWFVVWRTWAGKTSRWPLPWLRGWWEVKVKNCNLGIDTDNWEEGMVFRRFCGGCRGKWPSGCGEQEGQRAVKGPQGLQHLGLGACCLATAETVVREPHWFCLPGAEVRGWLEAWQGPLDLRACSSELFWAVPKTSGDRQAFSVALVSA